MLCACSRNFKPSRISTKQELASVPNEQVLIDCDQQEKCYDRKKSADFDVPDEDIDKLFAFIRRCKCRCAKERCCCEDEEDGGEPPVENWGRSGNQWLRYTKIAVFVVVWLIFTVILMTKNEKPILMHEIAVPETEVRSYWLREHPTTNQLLLQLRGPFLPKAYGNLSDKLLSVWIESVQVSPGLEPMANLSAFKSTNITSVKNITDVWRIPTVSKDMLDFVPDILIKKRFEWETEHGMVPHSILRIQMTTNLQASFPLSLYVDVQPVDLGISIILAAVVLLGLYAAIITEIIPRTLAALCGSTMSVAILAAMNERPTMSELISWIDMETLLLLFSMMMIMGVLSETGIFDRLSVMAYKISGGKPLQLAALMCFITAALSIILDNVTTVLLLTPCTIRLCNLVSVNPVPVLMASVILSNIGGCITPFGDLPNVIIVNNEYFNKGGINFVNFSLHMGIGMIIVLICTTIMLGLKFSNVSSLKYSESSEIVDLCRHIDVWERLAASLSSYSRNEEVVRISLLKKVQQLRKELKKKRMASSSSLHIDYTSTEENLAEIKAKKISMTLFLKSSVALLFVIIMFFLRTVTDFHLSLGWIALLGAILLFILADNEPIDGVLARVEWGTLLFFASLFILMEATSRLGLIRWIGNQTQYVILLVSEEKRLAVAILLILWVSALASAFVDNIPLTTMMVRIIENLNAELELPLQPLVWALAFGACLGGNGTLIGASANVVCAGVAEQHGYRFTFMEFFKVGFPIMIGNVMVISLYLITCHVWVEWH